MTNKPESSHTPVVLSIAGSDSSAGAGIQADIKTCAAMGVYACTAVTAVTAQGAGRVDGVYALPASLVRDQMNAVAETFNISVVKLGMMANLDIAQVVADFLQQSGLPAVIDPVLKASAGANLCTASGNATEVLSFYREVLIPQAMVVTPNLQEAAQLLGISQANCHEQYEQQACALLALGPSSVLLKGGHSVDTRLCSDYLAFADAKTGNIKTHAFSAARLLTPHGHGTGCTLASAIAAGLAQGLSIMQAVSAAKNYLQGALAAANKLNLVPEHGPLHHFSNYW